VSPALELDEFVVIPVVSDVIVPPSSLPPSPPHAADAAATQSQRENRP